MTDITDVMSVENGIVVNACLFNVSDYHRADFFARVVEIMNSDISLRDVILSHVNYLCALLLMYGFDYSRGSQSVTFLRGVSADDVTTHMISAMAAGRQPQNNGAKIILLVGCHCLESMQQVHV